MRFALVGGGMSLLNYLLFIGAVRLSAPYLLAATMAWMATVSVGYSLNRRFTFGQPAWGCLSDLAAYVAGYGLQFLISLVGLWVLMGLLRLGPSVAFLLNLLVTSSFSFCYLNLAVFRAPAQGRTAA